MFRWEAHASYSLNNYSYKKTFKSCLSIRILYNCQFDVYRKDCNITALVLSLKASSTGLNLTMANNVFLVDPWWNPVGRADRIGQKRQVNVYRFLCKSTIEAKIHQLHQKNKQIINRAFSKEQKKNQDIEDYKLLWKDDLLLIYLILFAFQVLRRFRKNKYRPIFNISFLSIFVGQSITQAAKAAPLQISIFCCCIHQNQLFNMKTPLKQDTINQYVQMGFSETLIQMAWEASNQESDMMDTLFNLASQNQQMQASPNKQDEEMLLNQALLDSFKTNPQTQSTFELVSPEQRRRVDQVPCGLKNVGNTCYFNCLLQTYFFNAEFVKTIIKFQPPLEQGNVSHSKSIELVKNLQSLFMNMIGSDKKYVDPSDVVKSICDDFGNVLPIGDQKDVGEFNHYFLSRIDEGLASNEHQQSQIHEAPQTSSILRLKSSTIHDEDVVSQLFFSKVHHYLKFNQGGQPQCRESVDIFNFIPLDVKDGNLYDSFDSFVVNEIEDYKNDLTESVQATKYNWIQQPPQTLSFQVQRVMYSKEKNELIKVNDEFQFEEEIYLDRFLDENSQKYVHIRNVNKEYKAKQKKIKQDQQQLVKFNDQYDLQDTLNTIIKFLKLQTPNEPDHPANFGKSDQKNTIKELESFANKVSTRKQVLQQQYLDLENKIQSAYNDLKKHKYILQSILIHDGMANSGHYYAYIRDFKLAKWFKFNDIHVSEEKREKVMQDAIGAKPGVNAYLLIYVREDRFNKELQNPLRTYRISSEQDYLKDGYGNFLSAKQKESIANENTLFSGEIEDFKQARLIESIAESYQSRFEFINEHFRTVQNQHKEVKFKPLIVLNFPIFVKCKATLLSPQNTAQDNLIKWIILDSAIRDVHPQKYGVFDNQLTEAFKSKIINKFTQQFTEFKRPRIQLTQTEQNDFQRFQQEYLQYLDLGSLAAVLFDYFLKSAFKPTLQILHTLSRQVVFLDKQHYLYKLSTNLNRLIPLTVIGSMIPKDKPVDIVALQMLQAFLILHKDESQIWPAQISIMLNAVAENHNIPEITQIIQQFEADVQVKEQIDLLDKVQEEARNQQQMLIANYDIYCWSPFQKQDVLYDKLIAGWDQIKVQFQPFIKIQQEVQKSVLPFMKEDLENIIK